MKLAGGRCVGKNKRRILIIDDSEPIHTDFHRVLCPKRSGAAMDLSLLEETLFGPDPSSEGPAEPEFELDSAFQGQEGLAKVKQALEAGRPYALVFLDYRMPPGWNGVETLRQLRKVAPSLPVVLCSAYSDYSWEELLLEFGESQSLMEMRKPFDGQELRRQALALTEPRSG
ncbi:MAG: response regulator [Myxococcaceae bacterium]|nr:response regulator [Myxococcaceae bacterium]